MEDKIEDSVEKTKLLESVPQPEDKKSEEEVTELQLPKKFIAFIVNLEGEIGVDVGGMDLDEAFIIMKKGSIKFEKLYESYLRNA